MSGILEGCFTLPTTSPNWKRFDKARHKHRQAGTRSRLLYILPNLKTESQQNAAVKANPGPQHMRVVLQNDLEGLLDFIKATRETDGEF